jgi:hypothetical protein
MDRELTPAQLRELLPAYAIDAVDDDERAAIEAHLAGDPDGRVEVAALQRAATFLAHTGGPPPVGVWERLEAAIRDTPRPAAAVPPPRLRPLVSESASAPAPRAPRSPRTWHLLAVAATIVALALFSLWIVDRGGSDQPVDTAAAARAAAAAPGAMRANLRDDQGDTIARAVLLPDGTGYVTSTRLPSLGRHRTYQLWGVGDRATISLGVMGSEPKVVAFHAANPPSALAITNERAGGVVASEVAPTAVGELHT